MGNQTENPYVVLGVARSASAVDIKRAYFALVRKFPPEREPDQFRRIRSAYDALRTPAARATTDRQLIQEPSPFSVPRRLPPLDLQYHPEDRWREAKRDTDLDRADFTADFRPVAMPEHPGEGNEPYEAQN